VTGSEYLRVSDVVRMALASSVARFDTNEPALWTERDPEAVHQARIATRRLRSDLPTLRDFVDARWASQLGGELRALGAELGAARDIDVRPLRAWL
jgi:triphosphatase